MHRLWDAAFQADVLLWLSCLLQACLGVPYARKPEFPQHWGPLAGKEVQFGPGGRALGVNGFQTSRAREMGQWVEFSPQHHIWPPTPLPRVPPAHCWVWPSRNTPNKNPNKDPFATCGVALVLTSALGVVQTLVPAGRPGIRECLICRLLLTWFSWRRNQQRYLRFIDLPIVIRSVTWQGVRNQTNFLAPFSMLLTPYLAMPRLEIRQQPSLRIWTENLWWVVLKPQKHWESHSNV